ncbi:MAG: hypothetical protein WAR01_14745 [Dokdonella sp.]|uniref:hypothetical protein n=1 Tax=Dokdonella sp. TaxID=2291710 RepID=UPI0031C9D63E|nr:hypothetical protein [Xanthomonadales bacterium]MBK7210012.1 hypothetical protein [Xanthomonadales bacterium]
MPDASANARGKPIVNLLPLQKGKIVIYMDEDDAVVDVQITDGESDILLFASNGKTVLVGAVQIGEQHALMLISKQGTHVRTHAPTLPKSPRSATRHSAVCPGRCGR